MTDEKKKALLSVLDGMDVSEVISLLIMSGNSYSRRLLKFIKWITKWLPICIMVWRIPFLYLAGVILIRLGHGTLCISETTRIADYTLIVLTLLLYGRAFTLQDR